MGAEETQEQKDERMSWELFPDIPRGAGKAKQMTQDKQNAFAVMVGRIEDQLTVIPILTQNVLETESAEWLQRFAANVAELVKAAERAIAEAKSPAVNTVELRETVSRLRSWIRDYGDEAKPYFIADLETVLDAVVKAV